jgi:hypothetical protein
MAQTLSAAINLFAPGIRSGSPATSWLRRLDAAEEAVHRYLLVMRFALLNITMLSLLGMAWLQGWVPALFAHDTTHIVKVIVAAFAAGLAQAAVRVWKLSQELNEIKERRFSPNSRAGRYLADVKTMDGTGRATMAASLKLKLASRLQSLRYIAGTLILLGLIGTVVGFIIALSGVNPATVSDVNAIGPMVSMLLTGMAVALHTTLVGSLLNIWLTLNCRLVETGTVHYLTSLVELGERHARP